jgi:hypothetical protein
MRWCSWLRHCATSRDVWGLIPIASLEVFIDKILPDVRLIKHLKEMSTRNISWGKDSRCVRLTTLLSSRADCLEILEPQLSGTLRASPGLHRFALSVPLLLNSYIWVQWSAFITLHSPLSFITVLDPSAKVKL